MLAQQALKEAIGEVDKHLPGKHNQKEHGRIKDSRQIDLRSELLRLRPQLSDVANRVLQSRDWPEGDGACDAIVEGWIEELKRVLPDVELDVDDQGTAPYLPAHTALLVIRDGKEYQVDLPWRLYETFLGNAQFKVNKKAKIFPDQITVIPFEEEDWDEGEEKHLAGRHNQKDHGRLGHVKIETVGIGMTPEEYGVAEEYANAMEPNTLAAGTKVEGTRPAGMGGSAYAVGRATGRSRKTKGQAVRTIKKLQEVYPDTQYFYHYEMGRYQIIQMGDGPIKSLVSKKGQPKKLPKPIVVVKPDEVLPAVTNPIISPELKKTDRTRQYLTELLGLPDRNTGYGSFPAAAIMLAQGETILQQAIDETRVDVPKYLVERAEKDFGFKLSVKQPEPLGPDSKPSNFYWVTIEEAMNIAANEDKHYQDLRIEGDLYPENIARQEESSVGQNIRKNTLESILMNASPGHYRYLNDIDRSDKAVDYDSMDEIKKKLTPDGKIRLHDGAEWLSANLLTEEGAPELRKTKTARAFAQREEGLYLSMRKDKEYRIGGALVHERGHWVEYNNSDVYKAAVDFLKARRSSATPVRLGKGYKKYEEAYKDKFVDPYVGKVYPTSTEVISMGMDRMYSDGPSFFRSDPDHYLLTLAAMYGRHRPKV